MTADSEALPAQDTGAERVILGLCLTSPFALERARLLLDSADWYLPAHVHIWRAMCDLADGSKPTDPVAVKDELARRGDLALVLKATRNTYLVDLYGDAPGVPGDVGHYAEIVRDKAQRRRLMALATTLAQVAKNGADVDTAYEDAFAALEKARDASGSERGAGRRHLVFKRASDAKVTSPRWLLDGRIPLGFITLLAGREGIGKSNCAAAYAAAVTKGLLPGEFQGKPKSVVVHATEDSWESVIVPRLMAAGADLERVFHVAAVEADGKDSTLSVPKDLDGLAEKCTAHDVALILLDPLMSVVPGDIDTHKERAVRQALDPVVAFADEVRVAVVGLIHANKSGTTDPLNSIMGSRAFTAVARSVLYAVVDPECEEEDRFLLGHPKCNLGPKRSSQRYHITTARVPDHQGVEIVTSRIAWDGDDERSVRDLLETVRSPSKGGPAMEKAVAWLNEHLFRAGGVAPSEETKAAGKTAGHSPRTLQAALRAGGGDYFREGMPGVTYWCLKDGKPLSLDGGGGSS